MARNIAVVVAAGKSTRMPGTDKVFLNLGGLPLVCHSIEAFEKCGMIDEIIVELGRVLLTLATAQDEGAGISNEGSLVQLTFTPKSTGVFTLELDLSAETAICPWHGHSDDHSVYIGSSNPNSEQAFSSLNNATVIIQ